MLSTVLSKCFKYFEKFFKNLRVCPPSRSHTFKTGTFHAFHLMPFPKILSTHISNPSHVCLVIPLPHSILPYSLFLLPFYPSPRTLFPCPIFLYFDLFPRSVFLLHSIFRFRLRLCLSPHPFGLFIFTHAFHITHSVLSFPPMLLTAPPIKISADALRPPHRFFIRNISFGIFLYLLIIFYI